MTFSHSPAYPNIHSKDPFFVFNILFSVNDVRIKKERVPLYEWFVSQEVLAEH